MVERQPTLTALPDNQPQKKPGIARLFFALNIIS
jgi:hypothetical protein